MDLNEVYLVGRSVDDVQTFEYEERFKYSFIIAVNYYSTKKQQSFSEFIPVSFWRNKSSKRLGLIKKGDSLIVNGRLSIRYYEKDGTKRMAVDVIANYVNVFKYKKEPEDLADLLSQIKNNQSLLDVIQNSSDLQLSDSLKAELAVS